MDNKKTAEIMSCVDHTLLSQGATFDDIKVICDDACKYGTASVCIPPCYVKQASEYLSGKMAVCTVLMRVVAFFILLPFPLIDNRLIVLIYISFIGCNDHFYICRLWMTYLYRIQ